MISKQIQVICFIFLILLLCLNLSYFSHIAPQRYKAEKEKTWEDEIIEKMGGNEIHRLYLRYLNDTSGVPSGTSKGTDSPTEKPIFQIRYLDKSFLDPIDEIPISFNKIRHEFFGNITFKDVQTDLDDIFYQLLIENYPVAFVTLRTVPDIICQQLALRFHIEKIEKKGVRVNIIIKDSNYIIFFSSSPTHFKKNSQLCKLVDRLKEKYLSTLGVYYE